MASTLNIKLTDPILPVGAQISFDVNLGNLDQSLGQLTTAIDRVYAESDKSRDTTPGERALVKRLDQIERMIVSSLPPEVKLEIANTTGSSITARRA